MFLIIKQFYYVINDIYNSSGSVLFFLKPDKSISVLIYLLTS